MKEWMGSLLNRERLVMLVVLTTAALAFSVQAKTPRDLDDLVDMRASRGEDELEDLGYRHYKTMDVGKNSIGYWWNRRKEQCIAVTIKDGRFSSITEQPEAMCNKDGDTSRNDYDSRHHGHRNDNLNDLKGMRASRGEDELEDLGYRHYKTMDIGKNSIGYWWNRRKEQCVAVTIKDGRFSSITEQPEAMCNKD